MTKNPTEYYCRAEGPQGQLHGQAIAKTLDDAMAWLDEWKDGEGDRVAALTYTIEEMGVVG